MSIRFIPTEKLFTPNKIDGRGWLALLLVILAAAAVRLAYPESVGYMQDQADLVTLVQDLVQGKSFPLVGIPSSSRFPNSPVTVYTLVPPYLISDNPLVASRYVVSLNLLAIGLLWFIGYRYFSPTVALIAGLAYGLNPWTVAFSKGIWAQNYLPMFVVLAFLLGLYGFLEGKRWAQILTLPVLLWAVQIHIAAWALMPVYGWLLWTGWKRTSWKVLLISGVVSALVLLPFVIGVVQSFTQEAVSTGQVQTLQREISLRGLVKPYGQMAWLMTGLGLEQYSARETADELIQSVFGPLPMALWLLLGAATILGAFSLWRRYSRSLVLFTLLWAFFPLLFTTIPLTDVFPFYFIGSIPALGLLSGIGFVWMMEQVQKVVLARRALQVAFAAVFVTQGVWSLGATRYLENTYVPGQFGTHTPIPYILRVRDQLRPYEDLVFLGTGDWTDISASGARVWASLLRDTAVCTRDVTLSTGDILFPKSSFAAVFTPNIPHDVAFDSLYQVGNPTIVPLRPGEGEYRIYDVQQAPSQEGLGIASIPPAHFENGVDLTGYGINQDGLIFRWTLPAATRQNYQYQITYVDSNGTPVGGQEMLNFWSGVNWCVGDTLISRINVTPPAEAASIRVTMTSSTTPLPLNIVSDSGNALGTWVDLPAPGEQS